MKNKYIYTFYISLKVLLLSIAVIVMGAVVFPYFDYYTITPQSFAVSDLSVTTQRDKYHIGDTVNISGSLYRAGEEELTLKVYTSNAKVVWTDKIPIGINDDKFDYSLVLSGPTWKTSGAYVIIAEIDDTIKSTKFELGLEKRDEPQVTPPSINQTAMIDIDLLAQKITQEILSSSALSQPLQSQQLDIDSLAQQITSQLLANPPISPPISNYANEMSQENTNLINEILKLKADNRELINQNNILEESISKLQIAIKEQFKSITSITKELAEMRTVFKELFG